MIGLNWLRRWMRQKLQNRDAAGPIMLWLGTLFLRYFPFQITCGEFERFVIDYYEGELKPAQRKRFEFHMSICPMCETHFRSYVRAIELGQQLCAADERNAPVELPGELVNAILAARQSS